MSKHQHDQHESAEDLSEDKIEMVDGGDELAKAQAEIADLKDKYMRAVAETQNIQRRAQRDVEDAMKYSVSSAAKPFLSVADNLARAMDAMPEDLPENMKTLISGIEATQRELQSALERMGVKPTTAEAGQPLNPHEHEVMFEVNTTDHPNGTIVQVLEQGYKIHDRLLRPARVSVAKNSNEKSVDVSV